MYVIEIYSTFKDIDYMTKKIEILKGMVSPLEFINLTPYILHLSHYELLSATA
jgi:hypothetical protein